jgi:hypothetical protein
MKRSSEAKKQQTPAPKRTQRTSSRSRPAGRQAKRSAAEGVGPDRYWMICPRCGLGLIETVKGAIRTEKCTACGAVWADPEDVGRSWGEDVPEVFKPFRKA